MRPNYTISTCIRQGKRLLLMLGLILSIPLLVRAQNCTVKTGQLGNTKICLNGNSATIQASLVAPPTLLPGFQVSYVLTKGKKLVIQELSKFPFFTVKPDTNYTIHTLVYDPETLDLSTVKLGRTTGFGIDSLLIEGGGKICGALDLIGSKFNFKDCDKPCFAQAGRLQISLSACLQDGLAKLKAGFAEPATVPDGFQTIFLLSSGDSLIIKQLGETASFFVNKEGVYTIHTLIYDPKTLKLDTLKLGKTSILTASKLLIQGGGQICGALDVPGARFNVTNCSCTAKVGSLQQILNECLLTGSAWIKGKVVDKPVVPDGYQVRYVLTSGSSRVIEEIGSMPAFGVTRVGLYEIHTFVYNPNTINTAFVKFGKTTLDSLNRLLVQGGGNICAALDKEGISFDVYTCNCEAYAGSLKPVSNECLGNGTATLKAQVLTTPVVPTGFQVAYLLSSGNNLVVRAYGSNPTFPASLTGRFTIHTLIYNPATFNLGSIQLGTTTINDLNKLFVQGGGQTCAALDLSGAVFDVTNCVCAATTGTIKIDLNECLTFGTAWLKASVVTAPYIPDGYQRIFVLTKLVNNSLVIQETSSVASFGVTTVGQYRIHTLIFNPNTLNLNTIVLGTTTAATVNGLLIQGGGTICGALDVTGLNFDVIACNCTATTGTLKVDLNECLSGGTAWLKAAVVTAPNVPANYVVRYVLTKSVNNNLVIQEINTVPTFAVTSAGEYRIHTLVFNPASLNLGTIVFGTTTAATINSQLVQGGGQICSALDLSGLVFNVSACSCAATPGTLKVLLNECLSGGTAWLKASALTLPNIPQGYTVTYILSKVSGNNLVIQDLNTEPTFGVTLAGQYRIHTLVYNASTFNLSSIIEGQTTIASINAKFVQGGGQVCGAIDLTGASFDVSGCVCAATPGKLKVLLNECLSGGTAWLKADVLQEPNVPQGYQVRYLLTKLVNNTWVIQQTGTIPVFGVTANGQYRIHTIVYNSGTLNLSNIVLGTTTTATVNGWLIQGGGQICAALDVDGVTFDVAACYCAATPGKLKVLLNECLSNGTAWLKADILQAPTIPQGYQLRYVLTKLVNGNLVIQEVSTTPTFGVTSNGQYRIHTLVYNPNTLNLNTIVFGTTTAATVNSQLVQGGGQICSALDVDGVTFDVAACYCAATPGKLKVILNECLSNGTAWLKADFTQSPTVPQGYQVRYVLTKLVNGNLVIQEVNTTPTFGVTSNGQFRIHTLVYNPSTLNLGNIVLGTTTAATVNGWLIQGGGQICAALDLSGATFDVAACYCAATPGKLKVILNECLSNGTAWLKADFTQSPTVPQGYQVRYVLTKLVNGNLVIQEVNTTPTFGVTSNGQFRIHTLVYNPSTLNLGNIVLGTTTAATVNGWLIQGGGQICAALDLSGATFDVAACYCAATPGKLKVILNECLSNGTAWLKADFTQSPTVPQGYQVRYVLTKLVNGNLVIQEVNTTPTFGVTSNGQYRIHTIVYNSSTLNLGNIVLGTTTAATVNGWLIQGGGQICAALDLSGATFDVAACYCAATPGKLKVILNECLSNGTAWLKADFTQSPTVPQGYQVRYVLTKLVNGNLVIQEVNTTPTFGVTANGQYRIHTIVYNPSTLNLGNIVLGTTTAATVNGWLIQGGGQICAALDLSGATFDVAACYCAATPGKLKVILNECLSNGTAWLKADFTQSPTVPQGYQVRYVLTKLVNGNLVIQEVNTTPTFGVTANGQFRIHTLVYNPSTLNLGNIVLGTTTAATVNGWLIQGGGQICAALDLSGATFDVAACYCAATPGKLKVILNECLSNGTAWLKADFTQSPTVPQGYQVRYVLTKLVNGNLVIQEVNTTPTFGVTANGQYRIHTLVYNPSTLNLGNIVLGTTTAATVNGWLIQGGGQICAALDLSGATFDVAACYCAATPGKLKVILNECLSNGTAWLKADFTQSPTVPQGYQVRYVLTKLVNGNLVIQEVNTTPTFGVTANGQYRIHTLVYNSSTLNLGNIVLGTTTAATVNGWLIQGGGQICAALDLSGATFDVAACYCAATPGKLKVILNECLSNGTAWLKADFIQSPTVPQGYQVRYVLTKLVNGNLIIQEVNTVPTFGVTGSGQYRIHTLVYNPNTLNLNTIVFGTTTAATVNGQLVQGGGQICSALDYNGLIFEVNNCYCAATPGKLKVLLNECLSNGAAWLKAEVLQSPTVPQGYQVRYVLTKLVNGNLVIQEVNTMPNFGATSNGQYRIHTLVYNPSTLNLGNIVLGTTTAATVNGWLIQGGGQICAALDLSGATFDVASCYCSATPGKLKVLLNECLSNGTAWLKAETLQAPTIPQGYQVRYVLSKFVNGNLVIQETGSSPVFGATGLGQYRIHTLVYNSNTLNVGNIVPGTTTIGILNSWLIQGGGQYCGALDVEGVVFEVKDCACPSQTLYAGTLKSILLECVNNENKVGWLKAAFVQQPNVPQGYQVRYLLASGNNQIIQEIASMPQFGVENGGRYRILTLVYNPASLDLSKIKMGITTVGDFNKTLLQGGGNICAELDLEGCIYDVFRCDGTDGPCDIVGGRVTQVTGACLKNGPTYIVAKVLKKPIAPSNYKVVYLLTFGTNQTIVDFSGEPTFFLGSKGRYGINTLVYDPNYLNLREAIQTLNTIPKLSTFFYQGGGRHCGMVELGGAVYNLDICDCDYISSGTMEPKQYTCWKGGKDSVVLNSSYKLYGSPVTTGNFKKIYLLTTKDSLKIIGINYNKPEFKVGQVGRYRIHSLVYDAQTLDLKIIKFGKTTAFDINDLLRQGDGKICASLDMNGALFDVVKCESSQSINGDKTKLYPNPTTDLLNLQFSQDNIQGDGNIQVEILDLNGKRFNQLTFAPGTTNSELNIGQLPSGMYMVKISYGNSLLEMLRFSKL